MAVGIPARLTPAEGRRFGLTVGCAFLMLAGLLWWRDHPRGMVLTGLLGALLLLGGMFLPGSLGPVYRGWMRLALAISKVTTPIVLGIVYFAVVTPIGLLRRALGHGSLRRELENGGYWVVRRDLRRSDLKRQF